MPTRERHALAGFHARRLATRQFDSHQAARPLAARPDSRNHLNVHSAARILTFPTVERIMTQY